MANTRGEKELRTDWPFEEGLTAGTTKRYADSPYLEAESSNVLSTEKAGIDGY